MRGKTFKPAYYYNKIGNIYIYKYVYICIYYVIQVYHGISIFQFWINNNKRIKDFFLSFFLSLIMKSMKLGNHLNYFRK